MFDLVNIKDIVRIEPKNFIHLPEVCIEQELNRKYSNKIILGDGLGMCLWDILEYGDREIYPSDGAYYVTVNFRYVVFKPFIKEVITGFISKCSEEGLQVSINFFNDIIIPYENIPQPSKFHQDKNSWVWTITNEGGSYEVPIDVNDEIKFMVVNYIWQDTSPTTNKTDEDNRVKQERSMAPFTVVGTINGHGLGLPIWWDQD